MRGVAQQEPHIRPERAQRRQHGQHHEESEISDLEDQDHDDYDRVNPRRAKKRRKARDKKGKDKKEERKGANPNLDSMTGARRCGSRRRAATLRGTARSRQWTLLECLVCQYARVLCFHDYDQGLAANALLLHGQ